MLEVAVAEAPSSAEGTENEEDDENDEDGVVHLGWF